jgi:hypothetical protein
VTDLLAHFGVTTQRFEAGLAAWLAILTLQPSQPWFQALTGGVMALGAGAWSRWRSRTERCQANLNGSPFRQEQQRPLRP